jgi:hypothetical protein
MAGTLRAVSDSRALPRRHRMPGAVISVRGVCGMARLERAASLTGHAWWCCQLSVCLSDPTCVAVIAESYTVTLLRPVMQNSTIPDPADTLTPSATATSV